MVGLHIAAVRLDPQRFEGRLEHEGVGIDHAIVRALPACLSEQPPNELRGGAGLRQHRASGQRSLARPGARFQLSADHLRDLGDGGPRRHSRLLLYRPRRLRHGVTKHSCCWRVSLAAVTRRPLLSAPKWGGSNRQARRYVGARYRQRAFRLTQTVTTIPSWPSDYLPRRRP